MKAMLSGAAAAILMCVVAGCSSPDVVEAKGSTKAAETGPASKEDACGNDERGSCDPQLAAGRDTSSNSDGSRTYKYTCDIGYDDECGIGGVCRDDGTGVGDCGPIMYCTSDFGCRDGMICVVSNPDRACFPPDTLDGCGICIDK